MGKNRFKLLGKLNQGSFGKVHKGFDTEKNKFVAIKVETRKSDGHLKKEALIYQKYANCKISDTAKWPELHAYAVLPRGVSFMVVDLLGPDIECIMKATPQGRLPSYMVGYFAYKMINLIKVFHSQGYVHRDIKPQNFVIEHYNDDRCPKYPEVFLVDYGLAKRYLNADMSHTELIQRNNVGGTVRYSSTNAHLGLEPSRRDDLQSLGYTLVYLALGSLPWQNRKKPEVMTLKMQTTVESLCQELKEPLRSAIMQFMRYVSSLLYDQEPDYAYCQELFRILHHNFLGFTGIKIR